MYENLAALAVIVFLYSIITGRIDQLPLSGPIVFVAIGLLAGPSGFGLLQVEVHAEEMKALAELTLALVLFIDAASANVKVLRSHIEIPVRLLLVGLPLTILLGFGCGTMLFASLSVLEVAIIATILAPTDAALGKAVVTNESVPPRTRESLSVESGLNDGICVPILFVFLALATGEAAGDGVSLALHLVAEELGIGALVGVTVSGLSVLLLWRSVLKDSITDVWLQIPVITVALACFAIAQSIGGSGFIASFCGGLLFGVLADEQKDPLLHAAEGASEVLALLTWIAFGGIVIPHAVGAFTWEIVAYSILSLTVIRMLPVYLSLLGSDISPGGRLFIGWFGPRGLASIVFGVIVVQDSLPNGQVIALTVVCTVLLSVLCHGFTANPLSALFKKSSAKSTQ